MLCATYELKMGKFKPEHLGQLNFYLEALDRDVKKVHEKPSIGVLLCKDKDDEVVEYALSRSLSPTMVAEYKLRLPDKALLQQKLRDIYESNEGEELVESGRDGHGVTNDPEYVRFVTRWLNIWILQKNDMI